MTALEMLEFLASVGYKACWYARRVGEEPVPHVRVSYPAGELAYHVNDKLGTREQAQELLEQNIRPAWEGIHTPSQAKT